MDVLVPFDAAEPKTRLDAVLDADERDAFARRMLLDVCETVSGAGATPTVLSTAPLECPFPVVVDDRSLTAAVDAAIDPPTAVVMADLPLATPAAVERLLETDAAVAVAPGLGGGTNALVVRHPEFSVDYHGVSVRDHREAARSVGASTETIDSFRLAVDVDAPADLLEVLLHADGQAREWLREAGFEAVSTEGRARLERTRG